MTMKSDAIGYVRVSTARQAERDLSLPEQERQISAYCAAQGLNLVTIIRDPGLSGRNADRPGLKTLKDRCLAPGSTIRKIIVHSYSRLGRDSIETGMLIRRLKKAGIDVVVVTQTFGDDSAGELVRHIVMGVDEYRSAEIGETTRDKMVENARQGYWNGARPPFGYRTVATETRGDRPKKVLAIDEREAAIIRTIFTCALNGNGSGPLGVKAIAASLNAQGQRMRSGARFTCGTVHRILTCSTYAGRHLFNRMDSRTRARKPETEWITLTVPAIIEESIFDAVQARLKSRNPKRVPPRTVSGPTLLTGLARCADCGAAMTLRTGKFNRYRYYTCARAANQGKTGCKGRTLPMAELDTVVMQAFTEALLTPQRLSALLQALLARTQTGEEAAGEVARLEKEGRALEDGLRRLYDSIRDGIAVLDSSLSAYIGELRARREVIDKSLAIARHMAIARPAKPSPAKLARFAEGLIQALANPDPKFRRAYLRLFIERIEVADRQIRIIGSAEALQAAITSREEDSLSPTGEVLTFVPEWRPLRDSNPCYRRERAMS